MKKQMKVVLLFLSALMLFTACGEEKSADNTTSAERKLKDTLTVAVSQTVGGLDCGDMKDNVAFQASRILYDTLIYPVDKDGIFKPALAESWEQVDGMTMIFKLREDVYFHNGENMTADDVVYSIKRSTILPRNKAFYKAFDGDNTKAIDKYTVEVKFKYPFAPALNYLSSSRGGIVSKKAVEEMGDEKFAQTPVGTGPFKFSKWEQGDRIIFEKNEQYWGYEPSYNNLIFRFITEDSVRSIELESGGVDAMFSVSPQDYSRLNENQDITVCAENGCTVESWQFNMQSEEWKDVRVRKAMAMALDTAAIVKAVYGDLGSQATGLFSDQIFGFYKVGPITRDVEGAKKLLAEAGYPNGYQGEINYAESSTTQAMLEIAQAQWKEAGIDIKLVSFDQATYSSRNSSGITKFGRSNFTASSRDPDHALGSYNSSWGGIMQPNDTHVDELMKQGMSEFDTDKRLAIYKELQEYIWSQQYSIPVVFPKDTFAYSNNVENLDLGIGNSAAAPYLGRAVIYEK